MADTIVNAPGPSGNNDSGAGWLVALVIIIVVAVGAFLFYKKGYFGGGADTTNINVTIPTPDVPTDGGAEAGGATQ